jgi:mannose-6-phosphate isomerase-like protein (cupin superfamily)
MIDVEREVHQVAGGKAMRYVFDTKECRRYRFPTHINEMVIDRKDCSMSEVFMVIVEPGKAVHRHKHDDMEQIFYVVEGEGILTIGEQKKQYAIKPAQVVRIPPGTIHTVRPKGRKPVKYLSIDCFCSPEKGGEPTWEKHVKSICREHGYRYENVVRRYRDVKRGGTRSRS